MSRSVQLSWTDPPAPLTNIEISMGVQGAPALTVLPLVAPGVQKLLIPDLADGTYNFRADVLNGTARSPGVTIQANVVSLPVVPADVTGFTATLV